MVVHGGVSQEDGHARVTSISNMLYRPEGRSVAFHHEKLTKYCRKLNEWSFKIGLNRTRALNLISETFERCSTNTTDEARLDVSTCKFWITCQVLSFDIRAHTIRYSHQRLQLCHGNIEEEKKNVNRVTNVEYGSFTSQVFSGRWWNGLLLLGSFEVFGWCISVKRKHECNTVITCIRQSNKIMAWIRRNIYFSPMQSIVYTCGSHNYLKVANVAGFDKLSEMMV